MSQLAGAYNGHASSNLPSNSLSPHLTGISRQTATATYSPPVQAILQIGHEQNLRAATVLGLVTMNGAQAVAGPRALQTASLVKLDHETELTWVAAGRAAEKMGNIARALSCYESALRYNPQNSEALFNIANMLRSQEDFGRAAEFYTRALAIKDGDGEIWGALGHCFLMTDDLPKAYNCYQQAIVNSVDSKNEPKLWYGIGILYDRYGSLEHAEEAFAIVIKMDPNFDKANEIYFRLGIIYKQQKNSRASLQCFQYILNNPPRPLTEIDVWFQIGHVYEQQQDFDAARDAYDRVLAANPNHAKVLQQLGGLYQRSRASFYDPERSIAIITKSLEHDSADAFSWYLLGRAYMTSGNFGKAYEAYQQAVYRDGKSPAFWCSIGVLYCHINQYHDSLDAYSRAIRINPYLGEVWFNLGALYESCNDQMNDAVDAYQRTLQLDPGNEIVQSRLEEIRRHQQRGTPLSAPPQPRDISPSSTSWLLASHANGSAVASEGESSSRPTSHASAAMSPSAQHHRIPLQTFDAARLPRDDTQRRPDSSHPPNGIEQRRNGNPTAPSAASTLRASQNAVIERPILPQVRSQTDERAAYEAAMRGGSYSANISSYQDNTPIDWMRSKVAVRMGQPVPKLHADPIALRQRPTATPPQYFAVPPAISSMAAVPPTPSYGGSLPALQSSDRELQERRWAMEQEDRRVRASPQSRANGVHSPVEAKRGKKRSSEEGDNASSQRKRPSPKIKSPTLANGMPSATASARPPSDEDHDEGANALLALAGGGVQPAERAPTPATPKRTGQRDVGAGDKTYKRPRSETPAALAVSAAS